MQHTKLKLAAPLLKARLIILHGSKLQGAKLLNILIVTPVGRNSI